MYNFWQGDKKIYLIIAFKKLYAFVKLHLFVIICDPCTRGQRKGLRML